MLLSRVLSFRKRHARLMLSPLPDIREDALMDIATETTKDMSHTQQHTTVVSAWRCACMEMCMHVYMVHQRKNINMPLTCRVVNPCKYDLTLVVRA